MPITAKIIEDSISHDGIRLTTFQLMYPRFIHSEVMTHRVFSRNASSSRAIPVKKMIQMVREEPAMPIHWGKNQPGMQANEEIQHVGAAMDIWLRAARNAANIAEELQQIGVHKQVANRVLEPFQHISVVLTATEFDNWFELRAHPDAQPEIQALALEMAGVMAQSVPHELDVGEWHLPYVTVDERNDQFFKNNPELLRQVSAARCCRVSYLKHDGSAASISDDLALCEKLVGAKPLHASPFEHQATPDTIVPGNRMVMAHWRNPNLHGNFNGWIQYRKQIEHRFK